MELNLPFPSLKNLALIYIGSECLNQRLLSNYRNCSYQSLPEEFQQWSKLKASMTHVVDNLGLPKRLLSEVWDIILQLYFQILDWIEYTNTTQVRRNPYITLPGNIFYKFCFNSHGEIDKKKMIKTFMENDFMSRGTCDMTSRFTFACAWCSEDFISHIWNQMDVDDRNRAITLGRDDLLFTYWIDTLTGSRRLPEAFAANRTLIYDPTSSTFGNMMIYTMCLGDKIASEYFWHHLTDVEKVRRARNCALFGVENRVNNLLCPSLQSMRIEDQLDIFNNNSCGVLSCFLQYPYVQFFFPTLDLVWHRINERSFLGLCQEIVFKMEHRSVVRYQDILQELWRRCPCEKKKRIIESSEHFSSLWYLMDRLYRVDPDSYDVLKVDIRAYDGFPVRFRKAIQIKVINLH